MNNEGGQTIDTAHIGRVVTFADFDIKYFIQQNDNFRCIDGVQFKTITKQRSIIINLRFIALNIQSLDDLSFNGHQNFFTLFNSVIHGRHNIYSLIGLLGFTEIDNGALTNQLFTDVRGHGIVFKATGIRKSQFADNINRITRIGGNDSNLLIVFYVQIMPDDLVMQLHRF
ncbi:beta-galactosidase [Escherichia coli]|nr:beta-galactosidase [Escherichia coli]